MDGVGPSTDVVIRQGFGSFSVEVELWEVCVLAGSALRCLELFASSLVPALLRCKLD